MCMPGKIKSGAPFLRYSQKKDFKNKNRKNDAFQLVGLNLFDDRLCVEWIGDHYGVSLMYVNRSAFHEKDMRKNDFDIFVSQSHGRALALPFRPQNYFTIDAHMPEVTSP